MTTQIKGNDTSTFGGNVDVTGNVITDAPAFSARLSTDPQSITTTTWTKAQFGAEDFDTNSNYDVSTYRFTPAVEGYYQINGSIRAGGPSQTLFNVAIYKNGSIYNYVTSRISTSSSQVLSVSTLLYLNGSTDYVELYGLITGTSPQFESSAFTSFSGHLARAV